ncbi:MAG: ion transporter, partial [Myxococcota bacterium]|nr:ion transporter [Myxococcota bacterium]
QSAELESLCVQSINQSSELLAEIDISSPKIAVDRLAYLHGEQRWLLELAAPLADKKRRPALFKAHRSLKKRASLLRAERQEKALQERLERIFGPVLIARFERLIFFLIFLVLGLLFYELLFVSQEDVTQRKTLALIDTAICFVFLSEFITKISLAQERWFYFRRRWFIDLLPSIPFVFFTDYMLLEHLNAGRAGKLLRLSRWVRYVRVIRPFIRLIRLVSFTLRGLDRVVRRYSGWLNKNLVFFERHQDIHYRPEPTSLERARDLYGSSLSWWRLSLVRATVSLQAELLPAYLQSVSGLEPLGPDRRLRMASTSPERRGGLEMPVEEAIHELLHLKGAALESALGPELPNQAHRLIGLLDIPGLRRFPLIASLVERQRESTPAELGAWMVRGLGRFLEILLSMGYWCADLYGIITGPRLVDRVGSSLVKAFERPAKRLLLIGGVFFMANFLVHALGVPYLNRALSILNKFLGTPVIVIGSICFIPLLLGNWLRGLAGQATELYRLTAEAQFINLLKEVKARQFDEDLTLLSDRVLRPMARERGATSRVAPGDEEALIERFRVALFERSLAQPLLSEVESEGAEEPDTAPDVAQRTQENKVFLLYLDYLDGALLHHSDVKTSEQLMGNLALRSLILQKLDLGKAEAKAIRRLDLSSQQSIIGPFMWFSLITQSISHNTAQLLLDYNRFAIPTALLKRRSKDALARYEAWLCARRGEGRSPAPPENDLPLFQSTDFSALHFLNEEPAQSELIQKRFGKELYQQLRQDREHLVRGIFSSYPLHQLPKHHRTLNPYQLYQDHLYGGQVFLLPFKIVGLFFALVGRALSWFIEKIKELRDPSHQSAELVPQNDFLVAARKVDRMRKPIYLATMRLRALADFQYLGLHLRGVPTLSEAGEALFERDLSFINAIAQERQIFERLKKERRLQLREYEALLRHLGWAGGGLAEHIETLDPTLRTRLCELRRNLAIAYALDYKGLQRSWRLRCEFERFCHRCLRRSADSVAFRVPRQLLSQADRLTRRVVHRGADREREGFDLTWASLPLSEENGPQGAQECWRRYQIEGRGLRPLLEEIGRRGEVLDFRTIFEEVIAYSDSWSEELSVLRTVQSLSILDVQNYRRHLWRIGNYAGDGDPSELLERLFNPSTF